MFATTLCRISMRLLALMLLGGCSVTNLKASGSDILPASVPPNMFQQTDNSDAAPEAPPALEYHRYKDRAYILKGAIWPKHYIPVCWEAGADPKSMEANWVRDAVIKTWQAHSDLTFASWTVCGDGAQGIRIKVEDSGPHTKGLGSLLNGKKDGMVLNFTFANWSTSCQDAAMRRKCIESIAVHEFGHAIAFAHEQNRPEAPGECALKRQGSDGDLLLTPYDRSSVMNYCNPIYNNNGELSALDKQAVSAMYPKP